MLITLCSLLVLLLVHLIEASNNPGLRQVHSEAAKGAEKEHPTELESLLEEFQQWVTQEGPALHRGKLPLGIHLLPLIDLKDLEGIGDLPSIPETFELAQAEPGQNAAEPASFLETGRGDQGNFWESVDLPQDLMEEVMRRMKHHKHSRGVPHKNHDRKWLRHELGRLAAVVAAEKARARSTKSLVLRERPSGGSWPPAPPDALRDILEQPKKEDRAWRDFMGPCSGFVPYAKAVLVGPKIGIDECWRRCTQQYYFCTQTHYSAAGQTCYFGHGLSLMSADGGPLAGAIGRSMDTCRSFTELGVREVRADRLRTDMVENVPEDDIPSLSPFTMVPSSGRYLLVQPNIGDQGDEQQVLMEKADTFLQCQTNCLSMDWCTAAVWIDRANGEQSLCGRGSMLLSTSVAQRATCPRDSRCMEVCGGQDCVPSIRNPSGMSTLSWSYPGEPMDFVVRLVSGNSRQLTAKCADSDCLDGIRKCQVACKAATCLSGWIEIASDKSELKCSISTSSFPIPAASLEARAESKGVIQSPVECPKSSRTCLVFASDHMLVPRTLQQSRQQQHHQAWLEQRPESEHMVIGGGGEGIGVVAGWGRCSPFHGGLAASPDSSFVASDRWECWRLCREMNGECTQVEYHNRTGVCVLGNGVASKVDRTKNGKKSSSAVYCHSIRNGPSATHGLPGMMVVKHITGAESPQHWFPGYGATTLVATLEECQTLCEGASDEATNPQCRYGGFESCRAVRAACREGTGTAEECSVCKTDEGGVCRIGSESSSSGMGSKCLSGACKWYEKGAVGFRVKAASDTARYVDHLPLTKDGLICPKKDLIDRDVLGRCYHNVASMWHCHALCEAETGKCMGGLYVDGADGEATMGKRCYLATYLRYHASDYEDAQARQLCGLGGCAGFTRDGIGKLPTLKATGSEAADKAVSMSQQGAVNMTGVCNEFSELEKTVMEGSPADFAYNPEYACTVRCLTMLQCMSFKVEGYPEDQCDLHTHRPNVSAGCETLTCRFSSTLASKAIRAEIRPGEYAKNAICVSRGVDSVVAMSTDSGVHDGLPGFYTVNAMARKFRWSDVMNRKRLILTPHLEGCQSLCRGRKGCKTGTWQSCRALKEVCQGGQLKDIEMNRTCEACTGIVVSEDRAPEDYPSNIGVCKLSSSISHAMFSCGAGKDGRAAGCYSFEKGRNNFLIMSSYGSPFIEEDASMRANTSLIVFEGEKGGYGKILDLDTCQYYCDKDPLCTYGHFAPRGIGFGDCFLTHSTDLDESDDTTIEDRPVLKPKGWKIRKCDGVCVVFKKVIPQDEGKVIADRIGDVIDMEDPEVQPDVGRIKQEEDDDA
ncbi:hypothetical protein FOL47_010782 [Perkinsus chesapeaki]|uniref:Apple domain-containing protein n=1 Tax=Perkinsus chesapeaki TaxID=330153 RepID=A0A7J6MNV9_PERCH|nr:hypothetical protein FOL47_010782 [Perkinsus chesapeaki]